MKDLGEASFVLGIKILRDHSQGILRLSQESYINKVLGRFGMKDSKPRDTPIKETNSISNNAPIMTLKELRCRRFPMH